MVRYFIRLKSKIKRSILDLWNFFKNESLVVTLIKVLLKTIKDYYLTLKMMVEYHWDTYLRDKWIYKNNIKKWDPILKIDCQSDPVFLLLVIRHKLSLIEKIWGTSTRHEGDYDEKEKLQELVEMLDKMIDISLVSEDIIHDKEYQKLSRSFFNKLHRLHDKLFII